MDNSADRKPFRPMLAATIKDSSRLRFPLFASPKLDGFRATGHGITALSRSMKPIPNKFVQGLYGTGLLNSLDAELMVGDPLDKEAFNAAQSGLTSSPGTPDFSVHVFDDFTYQGDRFDQRYQRACERVAQLGPLLVHDFPMLSGSVKIVPQIEVYDLEQLAEIEGKFLGQGYEGVMLRHRGSPYKQGRGTFTAHDLMKLKQFEDGEADIIGFEELQHNENEAKVNELGLTSRSTAKDGKVGGGTLGALIVIAVNGPFKGVEFRIGSGFTAKQRQEIWDNRFQWIHERITYKWFKIGAVNAPRFPVFKGRRSKLDMS